MLGSAAIFAAGLNTIASYFSVPSIGNLYTPSKQNAASFGDALSAWVKKVMDFFQIGVPIYPDKYEEKGGNEIGTQVLIGGIGSGNSEDSAQQGAMDAKSESTSATGALVKIMDNVVTNPRSWVIHGYMGLNIEDMGVVGQQLTSLGGIMGPFMTSFVQKFGRETLNNIMKKHLQIVSEARRPFRFTTCNGETLPALIKSYSVKNVPENLNWIEVDLEIQEFRFIALLSNNEQEMIGGVNGIYNTPQDALRQLSRGTLKNLNFAVAS